MKGALVAWSWNWLAGLLCKPLCYWRARLKAVMSLKLFIFHVQCSAHQEQGILARHCGMHGSLQPASVNQTGESLQLPFTFSSLRMNTSYFFLIALIHFTKTQLHTFSFLLRKLWQTNVNSIDLLNNDSATDNLKLSLEKKHFHFKSACKPTGVLMVVIEKWS